MIRRVAISLAVVWPALAGATPIVEVLPPNTPVVVGWENNYGAFQVDFPLASDRTIGGGGRAQYSSAASLFSLAGAVGTYNGASFQAEVEINAIVKNDAMGTSCPARLWCELATRSQVSHRAKYC